MSINTEKFYEKLSKDEHDRINELFSEIRGGKKLEPSDIFNSKEIPKMLMGINANLNDSVDWKNLHYLVPFYKTIITYICPGCPIKFDDIDYNLIEYYLDNEIILPVIGDYDSYPTKLIDLILEYPHTTLYALDINIINNNLSSINCTCKNCRHGDGYDFIEGYIKTNLGNVNNLDQSKELKSIESSIIGGIWREIKVIESDRYYTNKLYDIINKKSVKERLDSISKLISEVNYSYNYLTSQSLRANFVLNFDDLTQLKSNLNQSNEVFIRHPEFQKLILRGLHLYSPKDIPDFNYINLLLDNRKQIQNIVKLIPENYLVDANYIKIRSIFDDINTQVKELSSSKRMEFLKFSTNFISLNVNLLKSGILKLCGYTDFQKKFFLFIYRNHYR